MNKIINIIAVIALLFIASCDGFMRGCSSDVANHLGADWVIVQYNNAGDPIQCWQLTDVSVANEEASDGIYWLSEDGHLVHISGWYNRVQVEGDRWDQAASELEVDLKTCTRSK
jgi:hypothetical protein